MVTTRRTAPKSNGRRRGGKRPSRFVVAGTLPRASGGLALTKVPKKKTNGHAKGRSLREGLNAFHAYHVALPRAVAPYAVVRVIHNFTITGQAADQLWVFNPGIFIRPTTKQGDVISSIVGYKEENLALGAQANGIDLLQSASIRTAFGDEAVEAVPAAMTVRITCPTALQTATGQWFLGKYPINADPRDFDTYQELYDGFISYAKPRPLTSPRLAMKGVQVSATPRDMSAMADFLHSSVPASSAEVITLATYPYTDEHGWWGGLSPIIFGGGAGSTGTTLVAQVCLEFRYRFSLMNPASSTHTHHPPTTDSVWHEMVKEGYKMGSGVVDIVEGLAGEAEELALL